MFLTKATIIAFLLAVFAASAGLQAADKRRPNITPTATEIWSGKPLNDLLKRIVKHKLNKARSGALKKESLKHINVTDGAAHGNAGMLLGDNGNLKWPEVLKKPPFDKVQSRLANNVKAAVDQLKANKPLEDSQVKAIKADFKELRQTVEARSDDVEPSSYLESKRFFNRLSDAVKALSDKSAVKHFNGTWTPRGKNVAELVSWMSKQGLIFAPAVPGDEATYNSLYNALRDYAEALESAK